MIRLLACCKWSEKIDTFFLSVTLFFFLVSLLKAENN